MKTYDYLIIGGGIAGVSAAETIREQDASATIAIISNEEYPLYSRVLLPSYLKKRIPREKVFLRSAEDFFARRIDLYLREEVAFVDIKRKQIDCESGISFGYRKLLLASGGSVRPWERAEATGRVYRLQTLPDADKLFHALPSIKRPVVVGASFIGLEFLEILALNNTPPVLLVRDSHFFSRIFDRSGAELLEENFLSKKIRIERPDEAIETVWENQVFHIRTKEGKNFEADAMCVGIGILRNIGFLKGSGIEASDSGVKVNEYLESSVKDVYAAGDVAEYFDVISGKHRCAGNWTSAFLLGKTVGLTMAGKRSLFKSVPTYSITNFGFQITALGEKEGIQEHIISLDAEHNRYAKFSIREGAIVGASLINRFKDKAHISELIRSKTPIEKYRASLKDPLFDIQKIAVLQ